MSLGGITRRSAAAVAIFGGTALAAAYRFYRMRYYLDFADENDAIVTGWLISRGARLYDSLFSHHFPLEAAVAHLVAFLFPAADPAYFRGAVFLVHVLTALCLARSPLFDRDRGIGWAAGSLYLAFAAAVLPQFFGHMHLADVFWGSAFAAFLSSLFLPVVFGIRLDRRAAVLGGAALTLSLMGSLSAVFPVLIAGASLMILSLVPEQGREGIRAQALPALLGSAFAAAASFMWMGWAGSLQGFWQQAIRFNLDIYARYQPADRQTPVTLLLAGGKDWLRYITETLESPFLAPAAAAILLFLVSGLAVAAAELSRRKHPRWGIPFVALLTVLFTLRLRGGDFHSLPLVLAALVLASAGPVLLWQAGRPYPAAAFAFISVSACVAVAVTHPDSRFQAKAKATSPLEAGKAALWIRAHSVPGDRLAAFPAGSILHLMSGLVPATPAIYFLPWQARWEKETGRTTVCQALEASRPRFVYLRPEVIWNLHPWAEYGSCIDVFVKNNYVQVAPAEFAGLLWERRESVGGSRGAEKARSPDGQASSETESPGSRGSALR